MIAIYTFQMTIEESHIIVSFMFIQMHNIIVKLLVSSKNLSLLILSNHTSMLQFFSLVIYYLCFAYMVTYSQIIIFLKRINITLFDVIVYPFHSVFW